LSGAQKMAIRSDGRRHPTYSTPAFFDHFRLAVENSDGKFASETFST